MNDPLQRNPAAPAGSTLFNSTSRLAGEVAARHSGDRYQKILAILAEQPSALFEVAIRLGVFDHQISGRFTELCKEGLIERSGDRRLNPATSCQCDVWRITSKPAAPHADAAEILGYPVTLIIDGQPFDRGVLPDSDQLPGIPYSARVDGAATLRNYYRVELVTCPGCGKPLKMFEELIAGQKKKRFKCGVTTCNKTWELLIVKLPGGGEVPALVMKHIT